MSDDVPETIGTYLRLRGLEPSPRAARRRRKRAVDDDDKQPFAPGRDPKGLGDALADLTRQSGWDAQLAREDLVLQWEEVAGAETARHANPVALEEIVTQLMRRFPDANVQNVRFVGPDVPSWKWGPRAVPGRGPRDTYG